MKLNLIKRLGVCVLAFVLAIGTSTTAFATQATELENRQNATVQYYVSGTYTVDIPMYLDVTGSTALYASEMNITDDSYISVSLANIPENGIYTLTHTSGNGTVQIKLAGNDGEVTSTSQELARFDSTDNTSTPFYATLVNNSTNLKAGAYQGTVTFYFNLFENRF